MSRRRARSSSGDRAGSPSGWGMATAGMHRPQPRFLAMPSNVQTITVGSPCRSSSNAIVAPQRVPVPQVAVRNTPAFSLIRLRMSSPMAWPKRLAFSTVVALPAVA